MYFKTKIFHTFRNIVSKIAGIRLFEGPKLVILAHTGKRHENLLSMLPIRYLVRL